MMNNTETNYHQLSLELHERNKGKIEVCSKVMLTGRDELSIAYTPGVAEPCRIIAKDPEAAYRYTAKGNLVAIVTDGTAVLGLGDIGPKAAMPVMEGKAILFKAFGNVDAFPICLDTKDPDEIIETIIRLAPTFGGINLEDISAPRCFEIENRLKSALDIPVFHDDQHGTAIVVLAAVINAIRLTGRDKKTCRIVINGCGAAGIAIATLLIGYGFLHITLCDSRGIVNRTTANNPAKKDISEITNLEQKSGLLSDALQDADIFIGVSAPNCVTPEMIHTMKPNPIIFAMANPNPEIVPYLALEAGAAVVGTGRSDFHNQINNVLVFPGLFRGALDVKARTITDSMKMAAAVALAGIIGDKELSPQYVIPDPFDPRVADTIAKAVANAAIKAGVCR